MLLIPAALLTAERTDKPREPGVRSVSGLGGLFCCLASSSDVGDRARLEWNEARGWCLVNLGNFSVLSLRRGADSRDVVGVFFESELLYFFLRLVLSGALLSMVLTYELESLKFGGMESMLTNSIASGFVMASLWVLSILMIV